MADNEITLIVKSTAGSLTEQFNVNNKAQEVFDKALEHFRLVAGAGATYFLARDRDGSQLALGEKIEDLGLTDGEVLVLQANQAQDG
jgi:hypothetical protein